MFIIRNKKMLKIYLKFINGEKEMRYKYLLQNKKGFNPFKIKLEGGLK